MRDGAPLSRYGDDARELAHVAQELERVVVVGAPPTGIDWNPSGRTQAYAYADRVDRAAVRLNEAFGKWLDELNSGDKPVTSAELSFIGEWKGWFARWKADLERLHLPEWIFNPPASQIWLTSQQYDEELEAFRKRFEALTKGSDIAVPPPGGDPNGGHEDPGGIEPPGILDGLGITSAVGGLATTALLIGAGLVVLAVVKR